jgi:hypothetical protein
MRLTANGRPYFVDHNSRATTWQDPRLPSEAGEYGAAAPPPRRGRGRRLTNVCVCPAGSGPDVPQYKRDFQEKLRKFREQPYMRLVPVWRVGRRAGRRSARPLITVFYGLVREQGTHTTIQVLRGQVFERSFEQVSRHRPEDLRRRLFVKFEGEDGLDYGGVARSVAVAWRRTHCRTAHLCTWGGAGDLTANGSSCSRTTCSIPSIASSRTRHTITTRSRSTPTRASTPTICSTFGLSAASWAWPSSTKSFSTVRAPHPPLQAGLARRLAFGC